MYIFTYGIEIELKNIYENPGVKNSRKMVPWKKNPCMKSPREKGLPEKRSPEK